MKKRRRKIISLIATALALLLLFEFLPLSRTDPRRFDADAVARADALMWRDYYEKRRLSLFMRLTALLHEQYGLSWGESFYAAVEASRAAFVFKGGHSRADYEKALPGIERFYRVINRRSVSPLDAERVARLELEWWIVHRERESYPPDALKNALAAETAELYSVPQAQVMEYAELRARAMLLRDDTAERSGTVEADWAEIERLLHDSWRSLYRAVNAPQIQS